MAVVRKRKRPIPLSRTAIFQRVICVTIIATVLVILAILLYELDAGFRAVRDLHVNKKKQITKPEHHSIQLRDTTNYNNHQQYQQQQQQHRITNNNNNQQQQLRQENIRNIRQEEEESHEEEEEEEEIDEEGNEQKKGEIETESGKQQKRIVEQQEEKDKNIRKVEDEDEDKKKEKNDPIVENSNKNNDKVRDNNEKEETNEERKVKDDNNKNKNDNNNDAVEIKHTEEDEELKKHMFQPPKLQSTADTEQEGKVLKDTKDENNNNEARPIQPQQPQEEKDNNEQEVIIIPPKTKVLERRYYEIEIANLVPDGDTTESTTTTTTTTGIIRIETRPDWAPIGVEHFHQLMEDQFYVNCRFFRVIPNFMVQIGIHGKPAIQQQYRNNPLNDDPVKYTNARGTLSYAMSGNNTRTTQIFINSRISPQGNKYLDSQGFAPFAIVLSGMECIDRIYAEYREKPVQHQIQSRGNEYLQDEFPNLSYIKSIRTLSQHDPIIMNLIKERNDNTDK